jgi:peptidylprolyl isomerase
VSRSSSPTLARRAVTVVFAASLALVAASAIAAPAGAASSLPTVSGTFGHSATITFPSTSAPRKLESTVLVQGHGPVVAKGDLLVADYVGQIWGGKVFNTTYGQTLAAFEIGEGKVIKGWDDTLVGKRVGSRVLMVLPPADAYGSAGQSSAGITGTDTLAFVVDIVAAYSGKVGGDPHATVLHKTVNGITVGGPLGGSATITVAKNAPKPSAVKVVTIARGNGAKVVPGLIVDQYVLTNFSGTRTTSTWKLGVPDSETIGTNAQSLLDELTGVPVGSRVLVEIPKSSRGGPYAAVFDIVAEPKA